MTNMQNIEHYLADLRFDGYDNVVLKTEMKGWVGEGWTVKIVDTVDNITLLDRNGEKFMIAEAKTLEEALSELNKLAA